MGFAYLLTSDNGTRGGPTAISAALVPGRIRLTACWSYFAVFSASVEASPGVVIPGDLGPIWTSGNGGGLGSRCELGDAGPIADLAMDKSRLIFPSITLVNTRCDQTVVRAKRIKPLNKGSFVIMSALLILELLRNYTFLGALY